MARDGNGTYVPPVNTWNPAINGVLATSGDWQQLLNDIVAALTQSVSRDGQTPMTGNLALGDHKITGLTPGSGTGEALAFQQLFNQGTMADIASAGTTDIGAQNTNFLRVTGNTTITSFGTNYRGPRFLVFEQNITLTNSSTLVLPGAQNLSMVAGDCLIAIPGATLGTPDKWIVVATSSPKTINGGTANGVAYLNGSKVLTTGSALTFDGTNFGIGGAASMYWSGANRGLAIAGTTNGAEIDLKISGGASTSYLLQDLSSNLRFGNQGNFPIIFNVSDTEQMRLTSTGLGIGTTSAVYKLVVSNGGASGIEFGPAYSGTANLIQSYNRSGGAYVNTVYDANEHIFNTIGTQRMRLDSSGNLGLGVTPSAWGSGFRALDIGTHGTVYSNTGNTTTLASNAFYNGTNWIYKTNQGNGAGLFGFNPNGTGGYAWFQAASGTAGNTISFTQAMTLDASGRLLVGATSPSFGGDSQFSKTGNTFNLDIYAAGDATSNNIAKVRLYNNESNGAIGLAGSALVFYNANTDTERARIDSSGNLLVGATASTYHTFLKNTNNDWCTAVINTASSTPQGLLIRYTGASPNNSGSTFLLGLDSGNTTRFAFYSNGGLANYQGNNVNLSDRREKTNFAPAGEYLSKICAIPVQTFNYIDQNHEEDPGATLGVVAQDVQAVAPELVAESNWGTEEEPKMRLSVYQTDLQYALMKCIQEQQALINSLKARLDAANL
jgi:hypothetical protein